MAQRESKLSRKIMAELEKRGAFCFKVHGGPWMMAGLPDIIACYRGQFIAAETKMPDGGNPSPVQQLVHRKIRKAGGEVRVVRSVEQALALCDAVDRAHQS